MPVPSSGELKLRADINLEVNGNATDDNVSLGTLSNDVGFTEPDNMSEFYGYQSCTAPSVTTNGMSSVSFTSMTANGNVTADNGCTVTERGFYFGTSSNYSSNTKYTSGSGTGSYSRSFTGLNSSTTYYATAYAINSAGESRGVTQSSTTATPASYTLVQQFNSAMKVQLANYQSWAHNWGGTTGGWSCYGYAYYYHASYGWSMYRGKTDNRVLSGSYVSSYSPYYLQDQRYKRTDQTQTTNHRFETGGYMYSNMTWGSYQTFTEVRGGSSVNPSGCTAGSASTGSNVSVGYSNCNVGYGSSSDWDCHGGASSPSWYDSCYIGASGNSATTSSGGTGLSYTLNVC